MNGHVARPRTIDTGTHQSLSGFETAGFTCETYALADEDGRMTRVHRAVAAVPLVLIPALGVVQGGYQPDTWVWAGAIAAWGCAVAVVWTQDGGALRRAWPWVAASGALLLWTLASTAWSVHAAQSLLEARRTLLYAAVVLALTAACETRSVALARAGDARRDLPAVRLCARAISPRRTPLRRLRGVPAEPAARVCECRRNPGRTRDPARTRARRGIDANGSTRCRCSNCAPARNRSCLQREHRVVPRPRRGARSDRAAQPCRTPPARRGLRSSPPPPRLQPLSRSTAAARTSPSRASRVRFCSRHCSPAPHSRPWRVSRIRSAGSRRARPPRPPRRPRTGRRPCSRWRSSRRTLGVERAANVLLPRRLARSGSSHIRCSERVQARSVTTGRDSGKLLDFGGALDAHSLYLETLAELGPLGLLLARRHAPGTSARRDRAPIRTARPGGRRRVRRVPRPCGARLGLGDACRRRRALCVAPRPSRRRSFDPVAHSVEPARGAVLVASFALGAARSRAPEATPCRPRPRKRRGPRVAGPSRRHAPEASAYLPLP